MSHAPDLAPSLPLPVAPPRDPWTAEWVLIVDDDADLLELNVLVLTAAGLNVTGVRCGAECLAAVARMRPDLILLDINLPDICGLDLCRTLKTDPATAGIAILHLSGDRITSEEQAAGLDAGADGYIARPLSNHELVARVQAMLRVRRTEVELRRVTSELFSTTRSLRQMMEYSLDIICSLDARGAFLEVSAAVERTLGFQREELVARPIFDFVHPDDRAKTRGAAAAIIAGRETRDLETRCRRKDGTTARLLWSARWSAAKQAMFWVGRDITERKQAEALIAEQAALLDHASDAILTQTLEGCVQYWNKSAERIFGWTAADALGRKVQEFLQEDEASFSTALAAVRQHGHWRGEATNCTRDGREVLVECRWTLVRDEAGEPRAILAIATDITERKRMETQFLRAQRMESIGTLAGGIAHDLNNVLSPIIMSLELLKLRNDDPATLAVLETIETSARRGADMVGQVLSFARGVEGERLLIQPQHLLKDIEKIISDTFPKNLELRLQAKPGLWNVLGDPTQLHQVLLNLCLNARDAMPNGGRLTVTAENAEIDENYAAMNLEAQPGPHVVIGVQDGGCGMPAAVAEKIFDPFFTTKELGKGTGLGLSTSLAIVKSHGGFIQVYSEPGKGSHFRVHLPALVDARQQAASAAAPSLPMGAGELVMVIDDEESIRRVTQQTLEAFGYRVLCAADGAEAIALFARHQHEIALVLTDMMMPIMDGAATIHVLVRMNPQVKIIAVSGMNPPGAAARAALPGVKEFLPKPYTAEAILRALAGSLHAG